MENYKYHIFFRETGVSHINM